MNYRKQNSTNYPFSFYLVSSTDHITGLTGSVPLVQICRIGASNGASGFVTASGAITEVGGGWYSWAGNATDRGVAGEVAVIVSASGADTVPVKLVIGPLDQFDSNFAFQSLPAASPGSAGGLPVVDSLNGVKLSVGTASGQVSLSSGQVVVSSVTGNVYGAVGSVSGITYPVNFGATSITTGGLVQVNVQQVLGQTAVQATTVDANVVSINNIAFSSGAIPAQLIDNSIQASTFATNAIDSAVISPNALDSISVESGYNLRQAVSLMAAALAGQLSGATGTTITINGIGTSTPRIVATVDSNGNRNSLTLSPPT